MKEVVIMREYIMKGIKTTINSSDYISNINDVVGIIKDVTFEVEIIDIIKVEIKNGFFIFLKLKDNSGIIPAILIGKRDEDDLKQFIKDLKINDTYLVKGNINVLEQEDAHELDYFKDKIGNFIEVGKEFLSIKAIKEIED